jgi:hypothetical protein
MFQTEEAAKVKKLLTILIAIVWLVNGLFCKVMNLVPRHREIVGEIIGHGNPLILTRLIGVLELLMVAWIISGIKPRLCALAQITIVALMNIIELIMVPELLLFGYFNGLLALVFIMAVYINEFLLPYSHRNTFTEKH